MRSTYQSHRMQAPAALRKAMQRVVLARAGSSRRHLEQPVAWVASCPGTPARPVRASLRNIRPTDPIASNLEGWRSPSVCTCAKPIAVFGRQTAGSPLGRPSGRVSRVQDNIYKGLRGLRAGRAADGAGVDPRCAGLPTSVDRIDAAGGRTTPRHTRLVEHVDQMPGQRQPTRRSDPGDAGTDHLILLSYTRCHAADNMLLRFIMGSQVTNAH